MNKTQTFLNFYCCHGFEMKPVLQSCSLEAPMALDLHQMLSLLMFRGFKPFFYTNARKASVLREASLAHHCLKLNKPWRKGCNRKSCTGQMTWQSHLYRLRRIDWTADWLSDDTRSDCDSSKTRNLKTDRSENRANGVILTLQSLLGVFLPPNIIFSFL